MAGKHLAFYLFGPQHITLLSRAELAQAQPLPTGSVLPKLVTTPFLGEAQCKTHQGTDPVQESPPFCGGFFHFRVLEWWLKPAQQPPETSSQAFLLAARNFLSTLFLHEQQSLFSALNHIREVIRLKRPPRPPFPRVILAQVCSCQALCQPPQVPAGLGFDGGYPLSARAVGREGCISHRHWATASSTTLQHQPQEQESWGRCHPFKDDCCFK